MIHSSCNSRRSFQNEFQNKTIGSQNIKEGNSVFFPRGHIFLMFLTKRKIELENIKNSSKQAFLYVCLLKNIF